MRNIKKNGGAFKGAKLLIILIGVLSSLSITLKAYAAVYSTTNISCVPSAVTLKPPSSTYGSYGGIVFDCPQYANITVLSKGASYSWTWQLSYMYTEVQVRALYKMLTDAARDNMSLNVLVSTALARKELAELTCP